MDTKYLYHYFDKRTGPFQSLTTVSKEDAKSIMEQIKEERPNSQCASRHDKYVEYRHNCEGILRRAFAAKGGIMEKESPHYMVLGYSPWLSTWYEQMECIKIPVEEFDLRMVSFTYGDSMPAFSDSITDGREYRKKIYFYEEMLELVSRYGMPQEWNDDGAHGPERYIEVQVWSDKTVEKYIRAWEEENGRIVE